MKLNLLDRAINYISPARGAARIAARGRATMLQSVYDGASNSPRNASRRYRPGDANNAVLSGVARLSYAARDFERNNPLASRGIAVLNSNVIGSGITPSISGVRGTRTRTALQAIVNAHCDTTSIDVAGRQNLYGLEGTAFKAAVRDGESLMVRRRVKAAAGLALPFQIGVYEREYFDERVHGRLANGNIAVQGIEFDADGKAAFYHLHDRHPGDTVVLSALTSTRYAAEDVVHLYRIDRPGQAHGISWLAPVIVRLGDFEDMKDAYIMRQKIAACFAVFITKTDAAGMPTNTGDKTPAGTPLEVVEPGMIERLGPGESVSFGTPPVVSDLEAMVRVHGRDIAVGLGVTYEALTGDLSGVNFSSGRMGWLEFYRNIGMWTWQMVLPQMCDKVGGWIMDGLRLVANVTAGTSISWTAPHREMIDPASELKAAAQAVRDGLMTRSMFLRSYGFDPEVLDQERADELKRERDLGIIYDTTVTAATPPGGKQKAPPAVPGDETGTSQDQLKEAA